MSNLTNASPGVYTPGTTTSVGGLYPIWLGDPKGFRIMGGIIEMNSALGNGKVSDLYPKAMRSGTMLSVGKENKLTPVPTYRLVEDVTAATTKIVLLQGYGLPTVIKDLELVSCNDTSKSVKVATPTFDADGNAVITIVANALGVLSAGDALMLLSQKDIKVDGISESTKRYEGLDLSVTFVDQNVIDAGRILKDMVAPIPDSIWSKYLQTIKVN